MDKNINKLRHMQQLQDKVILYRNNTSYLKDVMKQTYTQELHQILNVEMEIVLHELKIPSNEMLPTLSKHQVFDDEEVRQNIQDANNFLLAMQSFK